jgi:maltooligosyltrehalose trehalohydrolase
MTTIRRTPSLQQSNAAESIAPNEQAPEMERAPIDAFAGAAAMSARSNTASEASRAQRVEAPDAVAASGKRRVTFTYDAGPHSQLRNLTLNGSWDLASGAYTSAWPASGVAMQPIGNGKWAATVELFDDGQPHDWEWGVTADGPSGGAQWAVMGEANLKFQLNADSEEVGYAPTTYHEMGAQQDGADLTFKFWAPDARDVQVKLARDDGTFERIPMERAPSGDWTARVSGGWSRNGGRSYVYEVVDSRGKTVDRADPYAREMMGEQRGVSRIRFDPRTGREVNTDFKGYQEWMRFEIGHEGSYESAYLVLKDSDGRPLSKSQVLSTLGAIDPALESGVPQHRGIDDLAAHHIEDDGRILMQNEGGTWTTLVHNTAALEGLRYELQVWSKGKNGQLELHDDKNHDGVFSEAERKASPNNDHWSDVITKDSGLTFRGSVITDNRFAWKHDSAPREKDPSKWVMYQAHVGSFFGMELNSKRSTFEDMMARLDYLKDLGITTLELLPVNEVEGNRDWGYMGANSLAIESSYGFEDEAGKWVTGTEALKRFIDEAHQRGLNVVNDVVYNHIGGNHNSLSELDGPEDPYFNWSKDPSRLERRNTEWGLMPAYNNPRVKQFFVDHAVAQVEELHFDGLRFDFTQPIKSSGGEDGWQMLREMNRQLHFYKPGLWTVAEHFNPYEPVMTIPAETGGRGGGGFDAQWYTEWQHRTVNDRDNPGMLQSAARGRWTNVDAFMSMMTSPQGLLDWDHALTIISNHDEVGNAQRTMNVAEGDAQTDFPNQWARSAARFAAGIGMASPGIPIFFQGDESGAQNEFRWGNPSTWDSGWSWESIGQSWDWDALRFDEAQKAKFERLFALGPDRWSEDPEYRSLAAADREAFDDVGRLPEADRLGAMLDITRRQSFRFFKDAIALRHSSRAFAADAEVRRVYTHNDNSVFAFSRRSGRDEFVVVGSLNHNAFPSYGMDLPPGQWKEVFNSDAAKYGGAGVGNGDRVLSGGRADLSLPAAGYVVLRRVG